MDSSGDLPFEPKSYDSNEWKNVYQNLKEDIAAAFDMMSPQNLPAAGGSKVSKKLPEDKTDADRSLFSTTPAAEA